MRLPPDPDYDQLLGLLYEGSLQDPAWQRVLPRLRELLDAQVASLVLRPPASGDRGFILNCVRPEGEEPPSPELSLADPADWQATAYREQFFALDPFINLPPDQVIALEDILPEPELTSSEYYRQYLEPVGLFHILGVDTVEPGGMVARLRFSRRRQEPPFNPSDRALLEAITPHLRRAIQVYAQLNRTRSERDIYAGAVEQLAVATIILDQQARVLSTNAPASELLRKGDGLALRKDHLRLDSRELDRELQDAITSVIRAQQGGEMTVIRALRIPRSGQHGDLGLVVRPAPGAEQAEGQASPCVAVFISDPDQGEPSSGQALGDLFGLTPAEARLALLLSRGLSLAEVAAEQNISQHTARAQLKSIFAKTGASRQAELVRLVLKSVAFLG